MSKPRGLGKGLGALLAKAPSISEEVNTVSSKEDLLYTLMVEQLEPSPFQPRQTFKEEALLQLSESIKAQGILQPVVVRRKEGGRFEIIAGERRWRAAKLAGLKEIPAIIKEVPDHAALAIALIENIQREDLNPIEEARALKRLAEETTLTHLEVSEAVGKSRATVTNLMRLLTLNPEVQAFVEEGSLEMGHARALLGLRGNMQNQIARTVIARGMSVRETERVVARLQEQVSHPASLFVTVDPNIRGLEQQLAEKLGAAVEIKHGKKEKGMLCIHYNSLTELDGILEHIH